MKKRRGRIEYEDPLSDRDFNKLSDDEQFVIYRNGGEGFAKWCDDHVWVPIYPDDTDIAVWYPMWDLPRAPNPITGKSYQGIWDAQKEVARKILVMKNGRFLYKLVVLCWMRGEGKSLLACLIQLWKFFCWPRQQIMLGANSKDQIKFVHYDIIRDIILNSPKLLASVGGKRNVKEKEICIKDEAGNIVSRIRAISSFSGIVSNITGYTFSEIFDMKNPKFFVQLDGSIRNIPNALGVIDSTVSSKTHVLYQLYLKFKSKETKLVYFHYRFSSKGVPEDYWNPNMDSDQLNDYRAKFPFGEFERYFLNVWSAGSEVVFTTEMIEAWHYIGIDGTLGSHVKIIDLITKKEQAIIVSNDVESRGLPDALVYADDKIAEIDRRVINIDDVYTLDNGSRIPKMATRDALIRLSDRFDTDFAVLVGIDRADPLKTRTAARTAVSCVAKGLPGSRSHPPVYAGEDKVPNYFYFLLHVTLVEDHSLEGIKAVLASFVTEYDGVECICSERWGTWDLAPWCEEQDILFDPIYPTYDRQRSAFAEFYNAVRFGRFKAPEVMIPGSKLDDILAEEASVFMHETDPKRWFGSPEKAEKYGIQDDVMFSTGWAIYGGREMGVDDFRERSRGGFFGLMVAPDGIDPRYESWGERR